MSDIIIKLRAIKQLADRGVGGEKYNAEQHLERLLKKHNLLLADLEYDKKDFHTFKNIEFLQLFVQVAHSVILNCGLYESVNGSPMIECTAIKAIEIEAKYEFYQALYKKELRIFTDAFFHKNNIFHEYGAKIDTCKLPIEEKEEALRVFLMAQNIRALAFTKQIEQ